MAAKQLVQLQPYWSFTTLATTGASACKYFLVSCFNNISFDSFIIFHVQTALWVWEKALAHKELKALFYPLKRVYPPGFHLFQTTVISMRLDNAHSWRTNNHTVTRPGLWCHWHRLQVAPNSSLPSLLTSSQFCSVILLLLLLLSSLCRVTFSTIYNSINIVFSIIQVAEIFAVCVRRTAKLHITCSFIWPPSMKQQNSCACIVTDPSSGSRVILNTRLFIMRIGVSLCGYFLISFSYLCYLPIYHISFFASFSSLFFRPMHFWIGNYGHQKEKLVTQDWWKVCKKVLLDSHVAQIM